MFVKRGVRGGVATIINRHSKANNPYAPQHYNADEASKYIMYLDANNLYGWAMSQPLPIRNFRFLTPVELETFLPQLYTKMTDDRLGYILEVELDYPDELHDLHNDYPIAPEYYGVPSKMLSLYAKKLLAKLGRKTSLRKLKKFYLPYSDANDMWCTIVNFSFAYRRVL